MQALAEGKLVQMMELTTRIIERKPEAACDISMQLVIQSYQRGLLNFAAGLSRALANSGPNNATHVAAASAGAVTDLHACSCQTSHQ